MGGIMGNFVQKRSLSFLIIPFIGLLTLASTVASAATVTVDCSNTKAKIRTISAGLALLPLNGPNTLVVSGTCNENVVIDSYTLLTIRGNPSATVAGADSSLGGIQIMASRDVRFENLTVTGGSVGIACGADSFWRLTTVTVRGAAGDGVVGGVASSLRLRSVNMENNGGSGLWIHQNANVNAASIFVRGNQATQRGGIYLNHGASLFLNGGEVKNNVSGPGIYAESHGTIQIFGVTISGNSGDGLYLDAASTGLVMDSEITGNSGHAVRIGPLSFGWFYEGGSVVSGNVEPQVVCDLPHSAARGVQLVGATTNCEAEQPPTQ
jgi:hypothetical protein